MKVFTENFKLRGALSRNAATEFLAASEVEMAGSHASSWDGHVALANSSTKPTSKTKTSPKGKAHTPLEWFSPEIRDKVGHDAN